MNWRDDLQELTTLIDQHNWRYLIKWLVDNGAVGGGALNIPDNYFFADDAARDAYFAAHPNELTEGIYVVSGGELERYHNSLWENMSTIVRGPAGPQAGVNYLQYTAIEGPSAAIPKTSFALQDFAVNMLVWDANGRQCIITAVNVDSVGVAPLPIGKYVGKIEPLYNVSVGEYYAAFITTGSIPPNPASDGVITTSSGVDIVFTAGQIPTIGGQPVHNTARWTRTSWPVLGVVTSVTGADANWVSTILVQKPATANAVDKPFSPVLKTTADIANNELSVSNCRTLDGQPVPADFTPRIYETLIVQTTAAGAVRGLWLCTYQGNIGPMTVVQLAGGGGTVTHDTTLTGDGTPATPLAASAELARTFTTQESFYQPLYSCPAGYEVYTFVFDTTQQPPLTAVTYATFTDGTAFEGNGIQLRIGAHVIADNTGWYEDYYQPGNPLIIAGQLEDSAITTAGGIRNMLWDLQDVYQAMGPRIFIGHTDLAMPSSPATVSSFTWLNGIPQAEEDGVVVVANNAVATGVISGGEISLYVLSGTGGAQVVPDPTSAVLQPGIGDVSTVANTPAGRIVYDRAGTVAYTIANNLARTLSSNTFRPTNTYMGNATITNTAYVERTIRTYPGCSSINVASVEALKLTVEIIQDQHLSFVTADGTMSKQIDNHAGDVIELDIHNGRIVRITGIRIPDDFNHRNHWNHNGDAYFPLAILYGSIDGTHWRECSADLVPLNERFSINLEEIQEYDYLHIIHDGDVYQDIRNCRVRMARDESSSAPVNYTFNNCTNCRLTITSETWQTHEQDYFSVSECTGCLFSIAPVKTEIFVDADVSLMFAGYAPPYFINSNVLTIRDTYLVKVTINGELSRGLSAINTWGPAAIIDMSGADLKQICDHPEYVISGGSGGGGGGGTICEPVARTDQYGQINTQTIYWPEWPAGNWYTVYADLPNVEVTACNMQTVNGAKTMSFANPDADYESLYCVFCTKSPIQTGMLTIAEFLPIYQNADNAFYDVRVEPYVQAQDLFTAPITALTLTPGRNVLALSQNSLTQQIYYALVYDGDIQATGSAHGEYGHYNVDIPGIPRDAAGIELWVGFAPSPDDIDWIRNNFYFIPVNFRPELCAVDMPNTFVGQQTFYDGIMTNRVTAEDGSQYIKYDAGAVAIDVALKAGQIFTSEIHAQDGTTAQQISNTETTLGVKLNADNNVVTGLRDPSDPTDAVNLRHFNNNRQYTGCIINPVTVGDYLGIMDVVFLTQDLPNPIPMFTCLFYAQDGTGICINSAPIDRSDATIQVQWIFVR